MSRAIRCALFVLAALVYIGCGDVPVHRYNYGQPVSFAFTDKGVVPVDRSVLSERSSALFESRAFAPAVDYPDYIDGPVAAADIQTQREAAGTFVASYTPDVFRIPMVKIGMLSTAESDGFWIILGNEGIGIGEEMEFFDFIDPIYVTDNLLWQRSHYDILFSGFELGISDIGGVPFQPDIQVVAPGYTGTDMPDLVRFNYDNGGEEVSVRGSDREYLGQNRFALAAGELFRDPFRNNPSMLIFRDYVSGGGVYRIALDYPWPPDVDDGRGSFGGQDSPFWDPLRAVYMNNNEWASSHAFGPTTYVASQEVWADLPFPGLTVHEDTEELRITIEWDLDNIIELWDFGDDGLHFQIAADFIDRFSVSIEQLR